MNQINESISKMVKAVITNDLSSANEHLENVISDKILNRISNVLENNFSDKHNILHKE